VQVFVYVGAVAVLIVFTILLTRRDVEDTGGRNWGGAIIAIAVFGGLLWAILKAQTLAIAAPPIEPLTVKRAGDVLMTDYVRPRKRPSGSHWSSPFTATIEQPTSINSTSLKDDSRDRRQSLVDSCGTARGFVDHPQSRQLASQCSSDAGDFWADRCARVVDLGVFIDAANARFPRCSQFHLVHFRGTSAAHRMGARSAGRRDAGDDRAGRPLHFRFQRRLH